MASYICPNCNKRENDVWIYFARSNENPDYQVEAMCANCSDLLDWQFLENLGMKKKHHGFLRPRDKRLSKLSYICPSCNERQNDIEAYVGYYSENDPEPTEALCPNCTHLLDHQFLENLGIDPSKL